MPVKKKGFARIQNLGLLKQKINLIQIRINGFHMPPKTLGATMPLTVVGQNGSLMFVLKEVDQSRITTRVFPKTML